MFKRKKCCKFGIGRKLLENVGNIGQLLAAIGKCWQHIRLLLATYAVMTLPPCPPGGEDLFCTGVFHTQVCTSNINDHFKCKHLKQCPKIGPYKGSQVLMLWLSACYRFILARQPGSLMKEGERTSQNLASYFHL